MSEEIVSASQRLPVEMWTLILTFAARCPLLPRSYLTFTQEQCLFSSQCDSACAAQRFIHDMVILRLVCRLWDAIILEIRPSVVYCNPEDMYTKLLPSHEPRRIRGNLDEPLEAQILEEAHRFEIWKPGKCTMGKACPLNASIFHREPTGRADMSSLTITALKNVQVFRVPYYPNGPDHFSLALTSMPKLKVLSVGRRNLKLFNVILEHPIRFQLTHLDIHLYREHMNKLVQPITFPLLQVLRISFTFPTTADPRGLCLSTWAILPSIHSLHIRANLRASNIDELVDLLTLVGPRLTSLWLAIDSYRSRFYTWFTPTMWNFFPLLTTLGPGLSLIGSDLAPPTYEVDFTPTTPGLLKLIMGFTGRVREMSQDSSSPSPIGEFIKRCTRLHITKIGFLRTWVEMTRILPFFEADMFGPRNLPKHVAFYRALEEARIGVVDRDEVDIRGVDGERFLVVLGECEERARVAVEARPPQESRHETPSQLPSLEVPSAEQLPHVGEIPRSEEPPHPSVPDVPEASL
ncbi:hypothetical protein M408DRAFT_26906 [Serendipita vermifera MAFF 305830]|uniref:Uncharacterized protein n=1 Tax=Serendipita vermifera MAFF 305830 TaxID=933852 RepID=A0A0C3AXB1_SERVB|nr:hypothetical protein M408DRAFT_26906 [Serendipita vermifera MAFF 305830]